MATKKNYKSGNNEYFRIRRTIDGRQKSFYGKSKGDAEQKYKEYLEELALGKTKRDNSSFRARADEYVQNVLKVTQKYATGTKKRYESSYNTYIRDSKLSRKMLKDIHPSDVQRFYNGLDVSMESIRSIHKFMVAFCKWCVLNGYSDDFMSAVEVPKKTSTKRHDGIVVWSEDEIRAILHGMDACVVRQNRHRLTFFVYVTLYTGARISEALCLRYSDFDNEEVNIERQCYMGEIKPPKYNSVRTIPMHDELKKALEEHKAWHEQEMKRNKYETEYVFTTSSGKMYDPVNVRRSLKRFYSSIGIEPKHVHAYRSTFCTQLCRCGVPLEVASKLMGHKSIEVTAAHYALIKKDTKEDAIKKLHYDL